MEVLGIAARTIVVSSGITSPPTADGLEIKAIASNLLTVVPTFVIAPLPVFIVTR